MAEWGWLHSGWRLETDLAARRTKLAQHIQEIEDRLMPTSSTGADMSASFSDLESKLARLEQHFTDLDKKVRNAGGAPMVLQLKRRSSS